MSENTEFYPSSEVTKEISCGFVGCIIITMHNYLL